MSEQRGTKEAENGDYCVNTILFTAATALLMAYLKRAAVVEQWRIWVFLFLNVVLLAIVLSAHSNNSISQQNQESDNKDVTTSKEETESKKENMDKNEESEEQRDKNCEKIVVVDECGGEEPPRPLSKEELNERAEAFIVMFRQHLLADAINHKRDSIQVSKHVQVQFLQVHG